MKETELHDAVAIPWNRYAIFFTIATLGCAADLLTKHWIFQWRGMPGHNGIWWLWEPYVGIETAVNRGALFGMGPGYGWVFAVLSVVAAVGILFWLFWARTAHDLLLTVTLALVTGGIGGNLYDRLGLWQNPNIPGQWRNEVRDWVLLRYGQYTWPNFNIADSLLVCGALLLLWHGLHHPAPTKARKVGSESPGTDEPSVDSG